MSLVERPADRRLGGLAVERGDDRIELLSALIWRSATPTTAAFGSSQAGAHPLLGKCSLILTECADHNLGRDRAV